MNPKQVENVLIEIQRKIRTMKSEILNFEALLERSLRPIKKQLQEHEEALELVSDVLSAND